MLGAEATIFFVLNPPGLLFLVLRRRIVSVLADRAFQCYDISHRELRDINLSDSIPFFRACDRD